MTTSKTNKKGSSDNPTKKYATSHLQNTQRAYHMKYTIMLGCVFSRYFAQITLKGMVLL